MAGQIDLAALTADRRAGFEWPSAAEQVAMEVASGRRTPEAARLEAERFAEGYAHLLRTQAGRQLLYAIRREGVEVGSLWAQEAEQAGMLWVQDVFVHPEVRRQGIAAGAVALVADVARERALHKVSALVLASNTVAIKLFRGLGYQTLRIHIETDPRLAKRRRIAVHKLRPMSAAGREAMLGRFGRAGAESFPAPDMALTCSAGNVLLGLARRPEGTTAQVLKLEPTDSSNLGTARLMAAVIRACQDRGDAAVMVQTFPERKAVFDGVGIADWRTSSVVVQKTLTLAEEPGD